MTEEAIDPRQREFMQHMQEMGGDMGIPPREEIERFIRLMRERMRNREEEANRADRGWSSLSSTPIYDWEDYIDRDWF